MASNTNPGGAQHNSGPCSPRAKRAKLEEALGKMAITDEEATPLVIDDREDDKPAKWLLAGRILRRNLLHIQTISGALKSAWGNPRGLKFRSMGENTFVAEFETQRDRDRIWEGSPWHVSRNDVALAEFDDCMRPDEVKFDRLSLWARVPNLPYNLHNDAWGKLIAQQIDKDTTVVQFDHVGGFLRARVSIEVCKPLRRWSLIDSAKRKKVDMYDIQYEHVPHFSCGRLGHVDLYRSTSGPRDANGDLRFGPKLRASDDWKKATSGDSSNKEHYSGTSNQRESKNSRSSAKGGTAEVNSRVKNRMSNKRKEVPKQAYRRVTESKLLITDGSDAVDATTGDQAHVEGQVLGTSVEQNHLWKMLWSLKVVPKVRVFWWRVMRGILPDEATLKYQHIRDTSLCKLCQLAEEDLEHALMHCSHARRFWVEAQALLDVHLPALHSVSWRKDILSDPSFSQKDRATIITIMRSIWNSRNKWTHEGERFDLVQSIKFIRESLAVLEIPNEQAVTLPGYGWQPPEGNQIKINSDAAVNVISQQSAGGGVARSRCSLLGAWGKPQIGVTDPLIAEALALHEGVISASLRGFSEVVMGTN
ncbi:Alanyl-tRNA synthetase [Hordeum vulgare]|nr:Alanyl-tRNA synthetase [Hordeum vulgare]